MATKNRFERDVQNSTAPRHISLVTTIFLIPTTKKRHHDPRRRASKNPPQRPQPQQATSTARANGEKKKKSGSVILKNTVATQRQAPTYGKKERHNSLGSLVTLNHSSLLKNEILPVENSPASRAGRTRSTSGPKCRRFREERGTQPTPLCPGGKKRRTVFVPGRKKRYQLQASPAKGAPGCKSSALAAAEKR